MVQQCVFYDLYKNVNSTKYTLKQDCLSVEAGPPYSVMLVYPVLIL